MIKQESVSEHIEPVCLHENKSYSRQPISGRYRRFKINTAYCPPRKPIPHPFYPTVGKFGLFKTLLTETLSYNFRLIKKEYREALLSRPCIYGVFSGSFGGFALIRERCTGCLRCVQEFPEFCKVERNPEFNKFGDAYWQAKDPTKESTNPYYLVVKEAEDGKIPVKGMGYKGSFADQGWDTIWTDMSEIVRPTRDGIYGREYISTTMFLGKRSLVSSYKSYENMSEFPIKLTLPIIFDHLPETISNKVILESVAKASHDAGILFIAENHQGEHLGKYKKSQILKVTSWDEDVQGYRAVELDVPMLFGLPPFKDQVAQIYDRDQMTHIIEKLSKLVERIRATSPSCKIMLKLPLTEIAAEPIVSIVKGLEIDGIHVYADYHGQTFVAPFLFREFVKDALQRVHLALIREELRDTITLVVSGGIILAEHVPKAIICGADLVAINTTALVALQVSFRGECRDPYEAKIEPDGFDTGWGKQRLVNLLGAWHNQLLEILSAMGMRDVRRLRGDTGRAIFREEIEKEAFGDIKRKPVNGGGN